MLRLNKVFYHLPRQRLHCNHRGNRTTSALCLFSGIQNGGGMLNYYGVNMHGIKRVQQWATFARTWHIYDAKWQNPFDSAKIIVKYLKGLNKPIYHPMSNCGDHVVVINCKHIALPGDEWKKRVYFHHTGYPGGASWTLAWELHAKDPTMILKKAVYSTMDGNLSRRHTMERLHLCVEENLPENILKNITSQIRQIRVVPKPLETHTEEEIRLFPKLINYPNRYIME